MFQRAWVPVGGVAREASTCFQSAEAASVAGAPQAASAYFSASVIGATPISGGGGSRAAQPTATGIPGTRDFDGAPGHYTVVPPVEYPAEPNASTRPSPGGSRNSPFPAAAQYNMQHGPHSGTMGFKAPSPRTPYGQAPAMQRIQSGAQLNRTPSLQFAMEVCSCPHVREGMCVCARVCDVFHTHESGRERGVLFALKLDLQSRLCHIAICINLKCISAREQRTHVSQTVVTDMCTFFVPFSLMKRSSMPQNWIL